MVPMSEQTPLYEERLPIRAVFVSKVWLLFGLMFLWAYLFAILLPRGVSIAMLLVLGLIFLASFLLIVWLRAQKPNQILTDDSHVFLKNGTKEYPISFTDIIGISPAVLSVRRSMSRRGIGLSMQARLSNANGEPQGDPFRINVVSSELSGWYMHWTGIVINTRSKSPYFFHCPNPKATTEKILKTMANHVKH